MTIHRHIAAGIDLGSNTFRLLVADCSAGIGKILAKKLATVRLGRGLEDKGHLHKDSIARGLTVLRSFRGILDHFQPCTLRICGTEALRQARNNLLFLQQAEEILQHPVSIINGEEEARLSLAGVLAGMRESLSLPLLLADVGGGSTELLAADQSAANPRIKSLPLGVVSLTERFITASGPALASLDNQLTASLAPALKELALLPDRQPILIIGSGGTATSMAALDQGLTVYNESLVQGHVLQYHAIEKLWDKLIGLPAAERNELPCLADGRGEILPAGIRIYYTLLKLLQQDSMRVSDTGLLEGIMLSSLNHTAA